MPDNAKEVQDALNEALTDDAGSQSAEESSPEVIDALKALEGEEDKPSDESAEESADDSKGSKTVPYDRLAKVVKQKNEISARFTSLEDQFNKAHEREQELRQRLETSEKNTDTLEAIKNLAQDENHREHVLAIDRALRGIEEEVVEAKEEGDNKALSAAEKRFDAKAAELETLVATQRADSLFAEATDRAKEMLELLPEGYTDDDKRVIGQLWTPTVEWKQIEKGGREAIPNALNTSLAKVIKGYGKPRGTLVTETTEGIETETPGSTKTISSEEIVKGLVDKDWAELDKDGKPLHSDADFDQGIAEMLRRTRPDV